MTNPPDVPAPTQTLKPTKELNRLKKNLRQAKKRQREFLRLPADMALENLGVDPAAGPGRDDLRAHLDTLRDAVTEAETALFAWKGKTVAGTLGMKFPE